MCALLFVVVDLSKSHVGLMLILGGFLLLLNLEYAGIGVAPRTTADRIQSFGYQQETHTVTTKDGYILTIFRICPNSTSFHTDADSEPSRPVVLMMHGLTGSSDGWVINGPSNALAFDLVDSGYDVWLGNARGTPYGRRHLSMASSERKFWRFSWHEIGVIDLPSTIDYILKATRQSSLHYVGYSQGTTVLWLLLSTRPEYNEKLRSTQLLAPIAYMHHAQQYRYISAFKCNYAQMDFLFGQFPLLQNKFLLRVLGFERCRSSAAHPLLCKIILTVSSGGFSGHLNNSLIPEIFEIFPASCSTQQALHFIQVHMSRQLRQYDFGTGDNLQRYNCSSPPLYELSNINPRLPIHLYYSDYDGYSSKADVELFSRTLGNKSVNHFIDLKQFAHVDFLWSRNLKDVINRDALRIIQEAEEILQGHNLN